MQMARVMGTQAHVFACTSRVPNMPHPHSQPADNPEPQRRPATVAQPPPSLPAHTPLSGQALHAWDRPAAREAGPNRRGCSGRFRHQVRRGQDSSWAAGWGALARALCVWGGGR